MSKSTPIRKSCDHCAKDFMARYQSNQGQHQRFCSRQCYDDSGAKRYSPEEAVEAFWRRVDKAPHPKGCWVWTGYCQKFGHGWMGERGLAHRFAYELEVGPVPKGKCVLHRCDNPPCCNPAHLFLGDRVANNKDAFKKRRHAFGERSRHAKLTEAQAQAIRAEYWYRDGRSNCKELAAKYGVSHITIGALVAGRTWRHLPHTPIRPRTKLSPQPHHSGGKNGTP
jgi:hypothetical protein